MAHRSPAVPDDEREREMDEALRALAEPRRRAILRLVAHSELAAGEIAGYFEVTRTAVSQHLTVLKNAGLVTERKVATRRLYCARPEGLAGLRQFLDQMWASSLEVARDLVEAERTAGPDDRASDTTAHDASAVGAHRTSAAGSHHHTSAAAG
jgi:DNA-binding transcriptional ArsR family regulator